MVNIELVYGPSGPGCEHVLIKDADTGEQLDVTSMAALTAPHRQDDSVIMRQLKQAVIDSGAKDIAAITAAIAAKEIQK